MVGQSGNGNVLHGRAYGTMAWILRYRQSWAHVDGYG